MIVRAALCLLLSLPFVACGTAQGSQYHYSYSWKGGATRSLPSAPREAEADPVTETNSKPATNPVDQHEALDAID